MPSVPTYDTPQVAPAPLGAPDQRSVASPEILDAGARSQMRMGQALQQGGADLGEIAYRMKQREDADSLFRAETALKDDYLKQEQDWRQNRQGRFAKDLTVDVNKWWQENIQKHSENLGNPDQRRAFTMRATRLREQSADTASKWEAVQLEHSHDESWAADKNTTIGAAAANPSPQAVDSARRELERMNLYQARRKGWDAPQVQAETLKDKTNLHKQVIQQLAQTNPSEAARYFDKFKDEIDGTQQAEIGKFAKQATAVSQGEAAASDIWAKNGPKKDDDPINLDKMEAEARAQFKGNEFAMKAAITALKERAVSHNSSQSERQAANVNSVMESLRQNTPWTAVERSPEFAALPGAKRKEIQDHYTDRQHLLMARGVEDQARLEREQQIKFSAAYHTYSDPDVLSRMSRPQVQALEPVIGRHYADSLLSKWEGLSKHEGALTEAKIDREAFHTIVRDFGFDPDKKFNLKSTSDVKEKARLGAMQDEIERQIGIEQKAKNRQLTREEKDTVARRTLSSNVMRSTWFGFSSEPVPAASVVPADLKKVVVPPGDREAIKTELTRRNKPVTDEEIARWYLLKNKR